MALNIPSKIWVFVERLYIHIYDNETFQTFLKEFDIDYNNPLYNEFTTTKILYTFMSEENYSFAKFIQSVPSYKYIKILERIVFDEKIIETKKDNWNYYGEAIEHWYPIIIELISLSGIQIDEANKKLIFLVDEYVPSTDDFIQHSFNDPFIDYIRKEINESYQRELYLSVMFLSRKLLEVIFIRVMEIVFPKISNGKYSEQNHSLWFDKNKNNYRNFGKLILNTKAKALTFQEDKELIEELCSIVKPFKDETNSCVHDDYKIPDVKYIQEWRVSYIINLSRKVFKKYCNP